MYKQTHLFNHLTAQQLEQRRLAQQEAQNNFRFLEGQIDHSIGIPYIAILREFVGFRNFRRVKLVPVALKTVKRPGMPW
jgi:hypothetical protein